MKNMQYVVCAVFLLALASIASAAPQTKPSASNFGPDMDLQSTAKGPPGDRVVVVGKQINEFVYWVGAQNQVIARDRTSEAPPEILKKPSVGYHRALSAEGIISTNPSVFLTDANVGPPAVMQQLNKVGIPIKVMRTGEGMADSEHLMQEVGQYFGRERQADAVVAAWQKNLARVMEASRLWANEPKPHVVLVHFGQAMNIFFGITGGPSNQVIEWAGGDNVLAGKKSSQLTPELMADAQPDIILAHQLAFSRFGSAKAFTQLPGVALTPAGKNLRIYEVSSTDTVYYSPRTPAAILQLAKIFHPAVFKAHPELDALYDELAKIKP
ncbi:MAG: ABC transporter substrate-binding protein [Rhodanobacter sp.]